MTAPDVVTLEELASDPHPALHRLRARGPITWVESLQSWLVVGHALSVDVMLEPETFTVDDPRFSTQQVIGPSMLSLDGPEHRRHRDPFAGPFRAARVREAQELTRRVAHDLVGRLVANGSGDLRSEVAAPLAVTVMSGILDLADVEVAEVLSWYQAIVDAVHVVTAGGSVPESGALAFEDLREAVAGNLKSSDLLRSVVEDGSLTVDEIASNIAVLLFGGIVTTESSAAIAFRYLLEETPVRASLEEDPSLIPGFVEETLRLEPSAAAVDRFATRDVEVGGVDIEEGDLVRVSISAANRDPDVFEAPDRLDPERSNIAKSVTFARGPHACLGIHLARMETVAAVEALIAHPASIVPGDLPPVEGLVFRVPESVTVTFS